MVQRKKNLKIPNCILEERGSIIVEMSIILPLIICLLLLLIFFILHMHDRNLAKLSIEHFAQGGMIELKRMSSINLAQLNDVQMGQTMLEEAKIKDTLIRNLLLKGTTLTFEENDKEIKLSLDVKNKIIFEAKYGVKQSMNKNFYHHDNLRRIEIAEYIIDQYQFTNAVKTVYEKNMRKLIEGFQKYMN